ncbi:MAG: TlpA disulfide reductase family protein [Bacteroidota bacterium]
MKIMKPVLITILFCSTICVTCLAQDAPVVKFEALDKIINEKTDHIKVINFWATWCAPCIKELPYFEALDESFDKNEVKVTLVSLDFADQQERVKKFMTRKSIESKVIILDEIDYNSWIDKVEKSWTGAIPATLIIDGRTGKRKFIEKELEEHELKALITEFIN